MSRSLAASVDNLKNFSSRLNKLSDEAAQAVNGVEAYLNSECKVGITTSVQAFANRVHSRAGNELTETVELGYARHEGRYRIVVVVTDENGSVAIKPWVECDRETKLDTVKKLPDLLNAITSLAEQDLVEAEESTASVLQVLRALTSKSTAVR